MPRVGSSMIEASSVDGGRHACFGGRDNGCGSLFGRVVFQQRSLGTSWPRWKRMDAAADAEVEQSIADLSPGKKVVLSQVFPERILHVLEASNLPNEEWASTAGAFYVPLKGKKATDRYHLKRQTDLIEIYLYY